MANQREYSAEEIADAIGQALKMLRKEKGLSQSDVYLAASLERNTYQKYDSGRVARPMFGNIIRIAEAMQTTPGAIFDKAYKILKQKEE